MEMEFRWREYHVNGMLIYAIMLFPEKGRLQVLFIGPLSAVSHGHKIFLNYRSHVNGHMPKSALIYSEKRLKNQTKTFNVVINEGLQDKSESFPRKTISHLVFLSIAPFFGEREWVRRFGGLLFFSIRAINTASYDVVERDS